MSRGEGCGVLRPGVHREAAGILSPSRTDLVKLNLGAAV